MDLVGLKIMSYPAHRNGDLRQCSATTIVQGQTTVFVNDRLWSVQNDPNTHGEGRLIPSGTTVFIEDKLVIVDKPDQASIDLLLHPTGLTDTAQGSSDTFAY